MGAASVAFHAATAPFTGGLFTMMHGSYVGFRKGFSGKPVLGESFHKLQTLQRFDKRAGAAA